MTDENRTDQNEREGAVTALFLKTNGPPPEVMTPSIPPHLLAGKSPSEVWLYEKIDVAGKQNNWLISQVSGLKAAHRTIHAKMEDVESQAAENLPYASYTPYAIAFLYTAGSGVIFIAVQFALYQDRFIRPETSFYEIRDIIADVPRPPPVTRLGTRVAW